MRKDLIDYRGPRIIINPSTFHNEKDAACVMFNEAFRILMEDMSFSPVSEPTDKQRKFFSDTAYANDEEQLRRTIIARIATFDTSVKDPTDEQLQETMEFLEGVMEAGYPQNEWEQSSVQRIHDVIAKAVGAPRADEAPEAEPEPPSAPGGEGAVQAAEGGGVSGGNPYFDENGKPRPLEDLPKLPDGYQYQLNDTFVADKDGTWGYVSKGTTLGQIDVVPSGESGSGKTWYSITYARGDSPDGSWKAGLDGWDPGMNINGTIVTPNTSKEHPEGMTLPAGVYIETRPGRDSKDKFSMVQLTDTTVLPWTGQSLAAPAPVPDYDFVTDAVTTKGIEKQWDEQFGSKQQIGPTIEAAEQLQQPANAQQNPGLAMGPVTKVAPVFDYFEIANQRRKTMYGDLD